MVGAAGALPHRGAGDPVVAAPARVELLDHRLLVDAPPQPGEADAADGSRRDVDVEQQVRRQLLLEQRLHQPPGEARRRLEGEALAHLLAEGQGRDAKESALEGGAHGPGVGHVVADVEAEVDAGADQVRRPVLQHPQHRQVDAVGGRAVDRVPVLAHFLHTKRPAQGQGMPRRALLAVRRHDEDLGQLRQGGGQGLDPLGEDAVVVGHQDACHGSLRQALPMGGQGGRISLGEASTPVPALGA